MDNIHSILNDLYSKLRKGIKPGLERTLGLAAFLDNPQSDLRHIHIAGTNGKGSICSMLASIFMESGYKTGLYTSPHILKFNERIQINGKYISDDEIIEIWKSIEAKANEIDATFFEITTVMAFEHFRRNKVDIAIIETGMGGKYDSTNIIKPLVSVIASVSMDHQDYLGDSLEKITLEKAGIIKENTPIIIQKNKAEVIEIINNTANNISAPLYLSDEILIENISFKQNLTMNFEYINDDVNHTINSPFVGNHQIDNHKSVLNVIEMLKSTFPKINNNSIRDGIKNAKINSNLRARLELLSESPAVILDGSHNPEAIYYCLDSIQKCGIDLNNFELYFACMIYKDFPEMLSIIRNYSQEINIVEIGEKRAAPAAILINQAKLLNYNNINQINIKELVTTFKNKKNNMLIFGSFYLISEFLDRLET